MKDHRDHIIKPPWSNDPARADIIPREASTVMLLRQATKKKPEVYMVKRHGKSSFMADIWVFPGGKLDPADFDPIFYSLCSDMDPAISFARLEKTPGRTMNKEKAFALYVAAARELFEETGILLASAADRDASTPKEESCIGKTSSRSEYSSDFKYPDAVSYPELKEWRSRILNKSATFAQILEEENYGLRLGCLEYVSHWLTPSAEPMRFDARFFAVEITGTAASIDRTEVSDGRWGSAEDFLSGHLKGERIMAPPTLRTIEELAQYSTAGEFIREMTARKITPILPKMIMEQDTMLVLLPWDADYEKSPGESFCHDPLSLADKDGPSRFVLQNGRFISMDYS